MFYYDDVTMTSFINIKYGDVATEIVLQQTACCYSFFCGQKKDLMLTRFTLRCVQCVATSVLRDQQYTFGVGSLPMKKMLGGQKFASDTEVQSVVRQWLGQQPASFFASGSQKLVDRWDKCLNKLGVYVEK